MVPPWIWYSIWKFWVIYVLVSLVFHVFSTAELISPCKTVNLAVWAFSSNFLHDFTLYGIDMNYIYHISSIATIFGLLSKVTILGHKCMAILGIRLIYCCRYAERDYEKLEEVKHQLSALEDATASSSGQNWEECCTLFWKTSVLKMIPLLGTGSLFLLFRSQSIFQGYFFLCIFANPAVRCNSSRKHRRKLSVVYPAYVL